MKSKKYSPFFIFKIICALILTFYLMMGVPTGWIYDLGVGVGNKQGQIPDQSVAMLQFQDDVENFYFKKTPTTVFKEGLIQSPLFRLRDPEYAGEHTHVNRHTKRSVVVSEYIFTPYPISLIRGLLLKFFASGIYNSYYLAPLKDGAYVCIYFDDYLMLSSNNKLPTGYIRYATTKEKTMLHQMAKVYNVNPVYVLDMYRHGKVNYILDFVIRAGICIFLLIVGLTIIGYMKKYKQKANQNRYFTE